MLIGGSWFVRQPVRTAKSDGSRIGSTVSFEYRPIVLLIALGVWCATVARGADAPAPAQNAAPRPASDSRPAGSHPAAVPELLVVVPTHGVSATPSAALSDDERILYVPRGTLAALRQCETRGRRARCVRHFVGPLQSRLRLAAALDDRSAVSRSRRRRPRRRSCGFRSRTLRWPEPTRAALTASSHPVRKTEDGFVLTLGPADASGRDSQAAASVAPQMNSRGSPSRPSVREKRNRAHDRAELRRPTPAEDDGSRGRGCSTSR